MRFHPPLEEGRLIRRYKRFLADIETASGEQLTIHCPNTGSMLNCMSEGCRVWFSRSSDPKRKLPGTWEVGETPQGRLACINTARANALVEEALRAGVITELAGFTELKREVRFGEENSRADFRLDYATGPAWIEVKSVTLGFPDTAVAAFPDARTERGAKHLRELASLARQGVRGFFLLFDGEKFDANAVPVRRSFFVADHNHAMAGELCKRPHGLGGRKDGGNDDGFFQSESRYWRKVMPWTR